MSLLFCYSGPKGSYREPGFFRSSQRLHQYLLIEVLNWSNFFYERKALDLKNVLHTHIDDIGCLEKFLETPQLKISFQNHHFLHFLALSQTSKRGCQGV